MITVKQVEERTMTPEKKSTAKIDLFCFYIGRPINYLLSIPFLYTSIKPDTITWMSIPPIIIGFVLLCVGESLVTLILGWFFIFLWSELDGIDGTVARYRKQYSKMGDTLDAAGGYLASALIFLGGGMAAAHNSGLLSNVQFISSDLLILFGALSGLWMLFPRLVLHKAINSTGDQNIGKLKDRSKYGLVKIIALNISSISGCGQLFLLIAILLDCIDLYTIGYFVFNTLFMIASIRSIFFRRNND